MDILTNRIGLISLGCPKALVDSERIVTQLRLEGYVFVDQFETADLVIVNTCGFIESAVEESLASIHDALKQNGRVLVTGCLSALNPSLIQERFPKVLGLSGASNYANVVAQVRTHLPLEHSDFLDLVPPMSNGGIKLTPRHYAYLKIAEGCNHKCSFCIIPKMRGTLDSFASQQIEKEARALVAQGTKELIVIAQDTLAYGWDKNAKDFPI